MKTNDRRAVVSHEKTLIEIARAESSILDIVTAPILGSGRGVGVQARHDLREPKH